MSIVAFAICAALLLGGLGIVWAERIEDTQTRDVQLGSLAAVILWFVEDQYIEGRHPGETAQPHRSLPPSLASEYCYQVWSRDGSLLMRSESASSTQPLAALSQVGTATVRLNEDEFRTVSLASGDGRFIVQLAERTDDGPNELMELLSHFAVFLFPPLLLVLGLTWWMLRRAFESVDTLADRLQRRNPLDVSRFRIRRPPVEIRPVLRALETLFGKIADAISVERRFTSMAAHEMRTPLSGIRAQAQLACNAPSPEESQQALKLLMQGVDRASHILEQLLDIAQVEGIQTGSERVDISSIYQEIMSCLGPRAVAKRITFSARFHADHFEGPKAALSIFLLLRNLISNAILYTPEGGRVDVSSHVQGSDVVLTVDDSGSGISPRDRERAFQRFNRLGQGGTEGAGLGLSIVLLVVEVHRGKIELLDSPLGGLRAEVRLPQPDALPSAALAPSLATA